ncbi:sulfurase [bacterium]|nr:sulfurase [bacterium]
MNGKVVKIVISSVDSGKIKAVQTVMAVAGCGLEDDKYFENCSKKSKQDEGIQVTLIENESIVKCNKILGTEFLAEDIRRNIVTEGVELNKLVGKTFKVGNTTLLGVKLCHPCTYLGKELGCDMKKGLKNIGGLRANILKSGIIKINDDIVI